MDPNILTDEDDLIRRAGLGDMDAFADLYDRYVDMVYRRVRYCIPVNDVEDVVQEVFIAVMKSIKHFRGESRFSTWLRTLVNRTVANYYRKSPAAERNAPCVDDAAETEPYHNARERHDESEKTQAVRDALRCLPERYQEVIFMRFAEGLRFQEIATQRNESLDATKSVFRRAIAALRQQMEGKHD
jgi:RNA polymerase sigma-70 factor (ECF subfamily)